MCHCNLINRYLDLLILYSDQICSMKWEFQKTNYKYYKSNKYEAKSTKTYTHKF